MEYSVAEKEGFKMSKPYKVERYKCEKLFEVFVNSISAYETEDLTKLRETARSLKIKGYTKMTKEELEKSIEEAEKEERE